MSLSRAAMKTTPSSSELPGESGCAACTPVQAASPGGKEAVERGLAVEIGPDAAHGVVSRGMDRSGLEGDIHAVSLAGFEDAGKARADEVGFAVGEVEEDVRRPGAAQLGDDGAGDDVARGELTHLVIAAHEAFAVRVDEACAFAAQGFGEKKARGADDVKSGGMKLDELDVGDVRAGAPGHGYAVAGRDIGIGGFFERRVRDRR